MKTKNLIAAISLLFVSMSTMSFTNMENDGYESAHAHRSSALKEATTFASGSISTKISTSSKYTKNVEQLVASVKNYLDANLNGQVDSVVVDKNFADITIYTKTSREFAVESKLKEMNNNKSDLDELIKKNAPEVVMAQFTIYNTDDPEDLFEYNYTAAQ